tara:strand:+ start:4462 stop:4884 length:423 start_codon:yes stop_codon:yes gene_type:complete
MRLPKLEISRPVAVWGNLDSGHGPYPPTPAMMPPAPFGETTRSPMNIYSATSTVKVGFMGKCVGIHRQYDVRLPHISLSAPFTPELVNNAAAYKGGFLPHTSEGSKTVKTNGVQTARLGDPIVCGSKIIFGVSLSVMIGE